MAAPLEAVHRGSESAAVEPHAVDDRLILFEMEQAGFWIAGLRPRGDGADLDKPEPKVSQRLGHPGILVEAASEPDRVRKLQPPQALRQNGRVGFPGEGADGQPAQPRLERPQSQIMRGFGREPAQNRPDQRIEVEHGSCRTVYRNPAEYVVAPLPHTGARGPKAARRMRAEPRM